MKFKFLFCLIFLCGCAYYNTFYNAKDCYKQAMVSTPPNQGLLEKSIQKSEKLISSYPNSKWVPEALLLMGKCFMEKGDYDPAIRKFKELIEYYPKNILVDDGRIGLARAYLKKGDYIEAKNVIKKVKKERMDEINILMVETYFLAQAYDTTIKIAKANLPNIRNSTLKSRTYTLIANSYDSLGKYKSAIKYYDKAFKLESKNLPAVIAIANASLKLNDPEQALDRLTHYSEVMTAAEQDTLNLMIAKSHRAKKDFTKAIEILDKIKTSPQATYDMGIIYEEDLQNLEKAKEYYEQTRNSGTSEISNDALVRGVRIDKLIEYKKLIAKKSAKADSLSKQKADTLKKETPKDSLSQQSSDTLKTGTAKDTLLQKISPKKNSLIINDNPPHAGSPRHKSLPKDSLSKPNRDTLKTETPKDSLSKQSMDTLKITTPKDSVSKPNPNVPKTTKKDSVKLKTTKKDSLPKQSTDTLKTTTSKDTLSKESTDTLKIATPKDSVSKQNPNLPKTTKKESLPMQHPGDRRTMLDEDFLRRGPQKDSLNMDIPGIRDNALRRTTDGEGREVTKDTLLNAKTTPDSSKDTLKPEDLGKAQFLLAELFLFEFKKIDDAILEYGKVITDYPESEYAPKAAYSIGWVLESAKKDTTKAISAYEKVGKNFKNNKYSPKYIELAKKAISRLKNENPKE
ncbi:MAG: tetratricopeptide repeat protein [bacterium]|nr:tetratricopeptide repeat protein [bacterium]